MDLERKKIGNGVAASVHLTPNEALLLAMRLIEAARNMDDEAWVRHYKTNAISSYAHENEVAVAIYVDPPKEVA